ncbi:MAG: TolC family protein, partial [Chitinophagaceae bacterium]
MNAKYLKSTILSLLIVFAALGTTAQDKWDLRRCVEFAVANNIQVRQADIQAKLAAITSSQSKASRFPSLNLTNSEGLQFGRSIDPATNLFTNQQIKFSQFQLGSNVTLFNWFSRSSQISGNVLEQKASEANVERLKNDISLNVAAAYLQALLARERVSISKVQLSNTLEQLTNTRKLVLAGSLPE